MKPEQMTVSRLAKAGEKILSNQRYRMTISAALAFAFNLLYAICYFVSGVINLSFWFMAMSAFYGVLAAMRFSMVLCERKKQAATSCDMEKFVLKRSGILLVVLSFILAAVNYISLSQSMIAKHGEIIMITIAAYTFYKGTMAIVRAVKQHEIPSSLLKALRCITYVEVAASLLTLQRSMLVSFGTRSSRQISHMNAVTGAAVWLFVLALGVSMMKESAGKKTKDGKIRTCRNQ